MSEGFAAFAQSFRMLFGALLTFSASGMVSSALIFSNIENPAPIVRWAFVLTVSLLSMAVLTMVFAGARGMLLEVKEGFATDSKDQRQINFAKTNAMKFGLSSFILGVIFFTLFLLTTAFETPTQVECPNQIVLDSGDSLLPPHSPSGLIRGFNEIFLRI